MTIVRQNLQYSSLGVGYPNLIDTVLSRGDLVPSRIGNTREVLNLGLCLADPRGSLVGRKGMSDDFAYEEIRQLVAGVYDGPALAAITPRAAELITQATAYGPRVAGQLKLIEQELRESPGSRRAVVYVGRDTDLLGTTVPLLSEKMGGEMPCTCVWQFHLRGFLLHMSVYMRSWDLVWGLSYDVPSFTAIQRLLAQVLDVGVGSYIHFAGSAHIYEQHWNLEKWFREDVVDLSTYAEAKTWDELQAIALATPPARGRIDA